MASADELASAAELASADERRESTYQRVYAVVRRIPRGRVSTYGEVARAAGCSGPRQAGYALYALKEGSRVPWHRVINARGAISLPDAVADEQRRRLAGEGVIANARGRIDLARYGWVAPC